MAEAAAGEMADPSPVGQPLQKWPSDTEQTLVPVNPTRPPKEEPPVVPHPGVVFEGLSEAELLAVCHDASLGWVFQRSP